MHILISSELQKLDWLTQRLGVWVNFITVQNYNFFFFPYFIYVDRNASNFSIVFKFDIWVLYRISTAISSKGSYIYSGPQTRESL